MSLLQLNRNPSNKDLRLFSGIGFPAFWFAAGLIFLRHHHAIAAASLWIFAGLFGACGLAFPFVIRPVYFAMMRAVFPIGWVMSHVILILAYFLILTPIGWLMRFLHDPMQRSFDRDSKSYWLPWESSESDRYFRQI